MTERPTPSSASPVQQIVIWGAGGHARVVVDVLEAAGGWSVAGFLDNIHPERRGGEFCGARILGGREELPALRKQGVEWGIVAIGECAARLACSRQFEDAGLLLATAVHPRAVVSPTAMLGAGTLVAAGAVVGPAAQVGEAVIVNTLASVDHDCVLEDGVHVGPGARLTGSVRVGEMALIGAGAIVLPGITIGRESLIGAGAVVCEDVPPRMVISGNPGRVMREV